MIVSTLANNPGYFLQCPCLKCFLIEDCLKRHPDVIFCDGLIHKDLEVK